MWSAGVRAGARFRRGDASKTRQVLGWEPTVRFEDLVREMVECDLAEMQAEKAHHRHA